MPIEIEPTHHEMAELLTDDIISNMTTYLMEDYGFTIQQALDIVYTSNTLTLLQQEECELYVQSPSYIYDLLLHENPDLSPVIHK